MIMLTILLGNSAMRAVMAQSPAFGYIGGTAYSSLQRDVFSFTSNTATLAQIKSNTAGVYSERRFMLNEAGFYRAAAALPTKRGNFGLTLNYGGFKNFTEYSLGLAYARSLGKKAEVGIRFNYAGNRVPLYGSSAVVDAGLGMMLHFSEKFSGGFCADHLFAAKISGSQTVLLPLVYSAGFGYDASPLFFVGTEIIKEEDKPLNVAVALQYAMSKQFFARAGLMSGTSSFFAGAGVAFGNFRLDVSAAFHPQLGISPGLLLLVDGGKR